MIAENELAVMDIQALLNLTEHEPGLTIYGWRFETKELLHTLTMQSPCDIPVNRLILSGQLKALKQLTEHCCAKYHFDPLRVGELHSELMMYCVGRISL